MTLILEKYARFGNYCNHRFRTKGPAEPSKSQPEPSAEPSKTQPEPLIPNPNPQNPGRAGQSTLNLLQNRQLSGPPKVACGDGFFGEIGQFAVPGAPQHFLGWILASWDPFYSIPRILASFRRRDVRIPRGLGPLARPTGPLAQGPN